MTEAGRSLNSVTFVVKTDITFSWVFFFLTEYWIIVSAASPSMRSELVMGLYCIDVCVRKRHQYVSL